MKRNTLLMCFAIGILLVPISMLVTFGDGRQVKETRSIAPFAAVTVTGHAISSALLCARMVKVIVSQGKQAKLIVQADQNILKLVDTTVVGDLLNIRIGNFLFPSDDIVILAQTPIVAPTSHASGGGCIKVEWDLGPAKPTPTA